MKHNRILILATAVAIALSSCSVTSPKGKTVSGSQGQTVSKTENRTSTEKYDNRKNDNKKHHGKTNVGDLADRIAGEWIIVSAGGKQIPALDDMPYITFEKSTNRFYASDGCNILNGNYNLGSGNVINFSKVLSTMKYCAEADYAPLVSATFSDEEPVTVKIDKVGHESFLRLFNTKGTELMSARKHNMDFLNGNWQIISVQGKTIDGDEATLFIDINELKVHGNTGCNFFNGALYINPDKSNSIDFSNLASTRMMCPNMDQESAILLALEETASAIQGSDNQVMLLSASGKELIILRKAETRNR